MLKRETRRGNFASRIEDLQRDGVLDRRETYMLCVAHERDCDVFDRDVCDCAPDIILNGVARSADGEERLMLLHTRQRDLLKGQRYLLRQRRRRRRRERAS